jgi:arylsulfatase A-like enzyme
MNLLQKGLLLVSITTAHIVATELPKQPNIVFIMADDLGWADVGYHGAKDIKTPNIDKLAKEGVKLETFYAQPMCTPSRAALMTGRYPMRYGLQSFVITPGQHYGLPTDERTIAEALKEAGYSTYALGKWHLGHSKKEYWPQNRGFDYFYGSTIGNIDYYTKKRNGVMDWQRNGKFIEENEYFTDLITKDAVRIIEEQDGKKPFFLYIAHLAVHSPYQAPKKYLDKFMDIKDETRRTYAAMAASMDDSVKAVVDALDRKGLRDNTLILFISDNGGIVGSGFSSNMKKVAGNKPAPADNGPYKGSKASLNEGAVRTVALLNWPKQLKAGTNNEIIHMVDWMPTLVGLAGGKAEGNKTIDGLDVWPVITQGKATPHESILINAEFHKGAVRKGDWKLIKKASLPSKIELYNLAKDVGEKNNVAKEYPKKVAELEALLNDYAKGAKASLYFKEYLPFIIQDVKTSDMVYSGDEDSGQEGEIPVLPKVDTK